MCDCTDDRSGAKEKSRKVEHEEMNEKEIKQDRQVVWILELTNFHYLL